MRHELTIDAVTTGAWVRFWRNGRLELGVVQYPPHQDSLGAWLIDTDKGRTSLDAVVEMRTHRCTTCITALETGEGADTPVSD